MNIILPAALLILAAALIHANGLNESERLEKYHERGYEWPIPELKPNTPGWRNIFERRFKQIEETMDDSGPRYNAWMQVIASSVLQPNFTENGLVY